MSMNMKEFTLLREKFPSWTELKTHFASEDGVGLRVVEQGEQAVIRYERSAGAEAYYRSVIWDTVSNLPLCVAPFRSKVGPPPFDTELTVEDFADGFMMNAWVSGGILQVATRTLIGGHNRFYGEKTFGQLFTECLANTPLKTMDALRDCLEGLRQDVSGSSAFASFVLQHPEHRVVAKFQTPGLYVVHTGYVTEVGAVHISERPVNWPEQLARLRVTNYAPRSFQSEAELADMLLKVSAQRGWRWQGLVFKDGTGARWKARTPTYTMLRELRGSEATSLERFFRLRAQRRVVEYLKHYGEERPVFWEFEQRLRVVTNDVLTAYTDVHKAHSVLFKDLSEEIKPAVYLLHVKWRDELRPKGFSVRLQNVIDVINAMRPFEKKRLMDAAPYVATTPVVPTTAE
jgi:hypothetical protein